MMPFMGAPASLAPCIPVTTNPIGSGLVAQKGALAIAQDTGSIYQNTDGGSTWVLGLSGVTVSGASLAGAITESGVIRPTGVTGALNDWAPTGVTTARTVYATLTGDTSLSSISASQTDGRVVTIYIPSGFTLTLKNDDGATGTAANRFLLPNNVDWQLGSTGNGSVTLRYDGTAARWKLDSKTGTTYPALTNTGSLTESGVLSPSAVSGTINNYAPTGFASARYIMIAPTATTTINGLAGGTLGRVVTFVNTTTFTINFAPEDPGSTATNRFTTMSTTTPTSIGGSGATSTVTFLYDGSRWRQIGQPGSTSQLGGTISTALTVTGAITASSSVAVAGTLNADAALRMTGEQTDTSVGAQNDYVLTSTISVFRWNGASSVTFSGFTGGSFGRILFLVNENLGASIILNNESASSTAANRIITNSAVNVTVTGGGGAVLRYDNTASRWRVVAVSTTTHNASETFAAGLAALASVTFSSIGSPTAFTGAQVNNWLPTAAFYYRMSASADTVVTGLSQGAVGGRVAVLRNNSSFKITLAYFNSGSTSAAQFVTPNQADLVMPPSSSAILLYDATGANWTVIPGAGCYSQASNTLSGDRASLPMASGRYYLMPPITGTSTSAALGLGAFVCAPTYVPTTVTVSRMCGEITSAGDVGSKLRLGIYADDGTGRPGALVLDAGTIAGDVVGLQEITGLATTIGPGWYWFGGCTQLHTVTPPTVRTWGGMGSYVGIIDYGTTVPGAGVSVNGVRSTSMTGALSATFPSNGVSTVSGPRTYIKT
jgi:hypothetical protein